VCFRDGRFRNGHRGNLNDRLYRSGLLANLGLLDRWSLDARRDDRLGCLDQPRRRQNRGSGLHGFRRLFRRRSLLALGNRCLRKDVTARQRNIPQTRETFDKLTRDDFFDCARGAFDLDAVIALQ
jgi:hypothetical protein